MKKGQTHTPESIERMRMAQSGKIITDVQRNKISASQSGDKNHNFGKPLPEWQKQHLREIHTGTRHTDETRAKMSASHKGKKFTEEHKAKIRAANIEAAKHRPDTWHQRQREAQTGKTLSQSTIEKLRAINSGSGNPAYIDGSSFEPYCPKFNADFKRRCRAFFNHTCVICGKTEEETGEKMHVHHVLYNKNACCDGEVPLFVTLCRKHHLDSNHNRTQWKAVFTQLINEKYGGKCYFTKEEYALFLLS